MLEQGTLAITARGDGSRWYGRVSVPESSARAAGIVEGMRVSARCDGFSIVIQADENGRIKFPPAKGRACPRHAFEAATGTLGLRDTHLSQSHSATEIEPGAIRIRVPDDCVAKDVRAQRRLRPVPVPRPPAVRVPVQASAAPRFVGCGAAVALATEASRAGRSVQALTIAEIVQILRDAGMVVQQMGARFFRVDGASATAHDLVEVATKVSGATEQNRIVLIVQD